MQPTDATVDGASAKLGEVTAIEVEKDRAGRRFTRDAASVKKVIDALGPSAAWQAGGMPRCRPSLWARLVPPSGEGGASFLFCTAEGPAYLSIPDGGTYRLPDPASRALHQAATSIDVPETGSIAPVAVTANLDSLRVTATLALPSSAPPGLRSVSLSTGGLREPDATWPDGSPISQSFQLSREQAAKVVGALALSGFFHRAKKFHSRATQGPGEPPVNSTEGAASPPTAPAGYVQVTVTVGVWHQTWQESSAKAIFDHTLVSVKRTGIAADPSGALDGLASQLP